MAIRRLTLRLILAALLLVAQQAAVTHAVWHAHDSLAGHVHDTELNDDLGHQHDEHSSEAQFCGFHAAFGQVLGVAAGNAAPLAVLRLDVERVSEPQRSCSHVESVPPQSRSPPVLS